MERNLIPLLKMITSVITIIIIKIIIIIQSALVS